MCRAITSALRTPLVPDAHHIFNAQCVLSQNKHTIGLETQYFEEIIYCGCVTVCVYPLMAWLSYLIQFCRNLGPIINIVYNSNK
jgi:hypothetical protein